MSGEYVRRLRGAFGVAGAWVRHYRSNSALSVAGIVIAVVLFVTLVGTGYGVMTSGSEGLNSVNRELWVSDGSVELRPGSVGAVGNPLTGAHRTAAEIRDVPGVRDAEALAFQAVYVSPTGEEFDTVAAVGLTGRAEQLQYDAGGPFSTGDVHYAGGDYSGPMTHEAVIDRRLARRYDLSVGDTVHVGGTLASARRNEFRVVGVSSSVTRLLGTPTVSLHLSELQEVSDSTGADRASLVAVNTRADAEPETVRTRLQRRFPEYVVRTNAEQFRSILRRQTRLIAGGAALCLLGVAGSVAVVGNTLFMFVSRLREPIAALYAVGVRRSTVAGAVVATGTVVGAAGGVFGCALAIPLSVALQAVLESVLGAGDVVRTPPWLFAAGFVLAISTGILGSLIAVAPLRNVSPADLMSR